VIQKSISQVRSTLIWPLKQFPWVILPTANHKFPKNYGHLKYIFHCQKSIWPYSQSELSWLGISSAIPNEGICLCGPIGLRFSKSLSLHRRFRITIFPPRLFCSLMINRFLNGKLLFLFPLITSLGYSHDRRIIVGLWLRNIYLCVSKQEWDLSIELKFQEADHH
jgi:hypothetical protein